ncbi:hypothetical protein DM01DRAFT_1337673 [Hesseltinella vesiculosa]|uniref:Pre-mRNA-processing protein 45 n=1 Tax=Hesseltinella vesiculosa TaxID=101127 RepID=A0A1X2GCC8_9FUNG|nr:hypothetical protein DM01DRAFT_1337673 [Hesseltinella vesiculosa]
MATLSSLLPKPKHTLETVSNQRQSQTLNQQLISTTKSIPAYGQRQSYRPRFPEDFGNGGAFPEINIVQYPLDMGRKKSSETSGGTLTLEVDREGNVAYDAIARQGHAKDRIVHTSLKDMVPIRERKDVDVDKLVMDRPSEDEVMSVAEKTKAALERIVNGKIKAAQPKNVVSTSGGTNKDPTYIRYTPAQGGSNGATQRIIRMVDAPVDPMAPPSFQHKKIPRGPPSPPAPVMHSPPRKLTAEQQAEWIIPPCISNWKNTKGYTIPLDKRLAADGRGLQELTINDKFAKFSEALGAADRHAREEVRQRNLMQQKLAQKEKDVEEEKLRSLAQKAREERSGFKSAAADDVPPSTAQNRPSAASLMLNYDSSSGSDSGSDSEDDKNASRRPRRRSSSASSRGGRPRRGSHSSASSREERHRRQPSDSDDATPPRRTREQLEKVDDNMARERDELRRERQKRREREYRMQHMGTEARAKHLARQQNRDVSEKIALGLAKPSASSKESMYDARLFNQSAGLSSGFKDEESYSLYDKPLFNQTASSIYKFRGNTQDSEIFGSMDSDELEKSIHQDKFGVKHGFKGAEGGVAGSSSGPVEFEKEIKVTKSSKKQDDVYGLDTFLNKAKKGKRSHEDLDDSDDDRRHKR